jgi:hypothetical protein
MAHKRLTTPELAIWLLDQPLSSIVALGETVELENGLYINNGMNLQPLRGRDVENSLQTFAGHFIWPLEPYADEIDYRSVAHGLACENRYGNQSPYPYPVAWHSVALSHVVPPHFTKAALIHDASEAYIKDIPRTIRRQEPFKSIYEAIEKRMLMACFEHFDVDYELMDNDEFLHYDVKMSQSEMVVWSRTNPVYMAKMLSIGTDIEEASDKTYIEWVEKCPRHNVWQRAEEAWLERYHELF